MKKALSLIIFALLILTSCSKPFYYERVTTLDFEKYNKQGFYISTTSNGCSFTPVAHIDARFYEGRRIEKELKGKEGIVKIQDPMERVWYCATFERMLDRLVEEARAKGGDGIVELKINFITPPDKHGRDYWLVSGLAVKMKD